MPQLRVLLGCQQGQIYSLEARPTIIGREPSSDIILDPESPASRRHAEIHCENGEWKIRDLGSRNGTLINGVGFQRATLNHQDEIVVGDNVFVFEYNDRLTAATEAAASRANPRESLGLQNDPMSSKLVRTMPERVKLMEREAARVLGANAGAVREVLTALLAGGHCLLTGFESSMKTAILDGVGMMLGLKTNRLKLTPSMSRYEVTGTDIRDEKCECGTRLLPGPLFTQLFMAENINHASEKAQGSVFSAMKERQLKLTETTWKMAEPFCVIATQENSAAWDGSCPLTPDLIDQVMLCHAANPQSVGTVPQPLFEKLATAAEQASLRALVRDFSVEDKWIDLAVRIACTTRPTHRTGPSAVKRFVTAGAGSNAALSLLLHSKVNAILAGRLTLALDDIQASALPTLRHRIMLDPKAGDEGINIERVIQRVLEHALTAAD